MCASSHIDNREQYKYKKNITSMSMRNVLIGMNISEIIQLPNMEAEVVLVERQDAETNNLYGSSGIFFHQKYVLITSNVLATFLQDSPNKSFLDHMKPGVLYFNVFESINLNIVKRNKVDSDLLSYKKASILGSFLCANIKKSCNMLKDFAVDSKHNHSNLENILSLFFILNVENRGDPSDLNLCLERWFTSVLNEDLRKGDELFLDGVPFGNRNFLKTCSRGIVSNIIGKSNCIVLSDCPSTPGCEGSPIYKLGESSCSPPIGITISSLSWWRGEWIGLTVFADIRQLLLQLLDPDIILPIKREIGLDIPHFRIISTIESSLAQIYCGTSSWGTAILVDKSKGIFVTNSHVLEYSGKILVHWKGLSVSCKCIHKTPESSAFDIAVIQTDARNDILLKKMKPISFSEKIPKIGDLVYSAGFSLFPKDLNPTPTLSKGQVSHYSSSLLKTTCFVHAGSSGGAILDPEGSLVGIIVCNIRMEDTSTVYPRFNMAIPILGIGGILKDFLKNNDQDVLNQLDVSDDSKKWGMQAKL